VTLQAAILAIMLGSHPHWTDKDESPEDRAARLTPEAAHVYEVAELRIGGREPVEVAAFLLALPRYESHWARYIQEGCVRIPKGAANCDRGKARSFWQAWQVSCQAAWRLARGSSAASRAFAECAARRWVGAWYRCQRYFRDPAEGAFAGYRSMCTRFPSSGARARTWRHMVARLHTLMAK